MNLLPFPWHECQVYDRFAVGPVNGAVRLSGRVWNNKALNATKGIDGPWLAVAKIPVGLAIFVESPGTADSLNKWLRRKRNTD